MSGTKRKPMICWDSCVFLAWLNDEEDKPLSHIEALLKKVRTGEILLLVSAVSGAEILDVAGESSAGTDFRSFIKRDNVIVANTDMRTSELAASYREQAIAAIAKGGLKKGFKAPDALIAATASLYHADVLHTFDPVLLSLAGSPIVGGLRITPPDSGEEHPLFDE